jgi:uridine monophosphate synthetase
MQSVEQIALTLFDIGCVRFGQFKLHSGVKSPIYIDLRLLISYPQALREAAQAYVAVLEGLEFDLLAGIPYAALPIGTAISLEMNRPQIFPRKIEKSYGTGRTIEGAWQVGQRVVVIEDLITSGDSIIQGIAALKASGLQVKDAVVLIDRQQGGKEYLEQQGYNLYAVMTMTQILSTLLHHGRITSRQRNKVLNFLGLDED